MSKKLSVEDFATLRGPFESGRQSPSLLGVALVLTLFIQSLCLYLEYDFAKSTNYPNADKILVVHFWLTIFILIGCLIYSIPFVYKRSQKVQYLFTILASQNIISGSFLLLSFFSLGQKYDITMASLQKFTNVILIIGALIFIATFIRFYTLLKKGKYRDGSERDILRGNLEKYIMSNLPTIIIACTGLGFVIQFLFRNIDYMDSDLIYSVILPVLLFFTMLFVLPEQLVILYCKYRFKSFNFNENGYLYPENEDSDRKLKNGI